jgi:hypothetical protein
VKKKKKKLRHEGECSPPSNAEVKNEWSYTSTSPLCLHVMHRNKFTFTHLPFTWGPVQRFVFFPKPTCQLWGPSSLISSGYWGSFAGGKVAGHESHHVPSSHAKVKNEWSYMSIPPIPSCHVQGVLLFLFTLHGVTVLRTPAKGSAVVHKDNTLWIKWG